MARNVTMRHSPGMLLQGTVSVISVLLCYRSQVPPGHETPPRIARYAYYRDYHSILKERLSHLLSLLQAEVPGTTGRAFVDSAPLNDRYWAVRAGLGWMGKNGLLITPEWGSLLWIGSLLVNIPIEPTLGPIPSRCGACRRCILACPTGALKAPRLIDATRCIAYQTIELRDSSPEDGPINLTSTHGWAFGCDACQTCCPFNAKGRNGNLKGEIILNRNMVEAFALGKTSLPKDSPLRRAPREKLRALLLEGINNPPTPRE